MKRILLSFFITLGILLILLSQISFRNLYVMLKTIDPIWLSLGSLSYLLATLFRALRFRWLIHSEKVPIFDLFRITSFYHLSLMVLPSKLGELSYPYFLKKIRGTTATEGLASLIASRVYDFFIVLMTLFVISIGFQDVFKVHPSLVLLLMTFLIGFIIFAFSHMGNVLSWLSHILGVISQRTGFRPIRFISWIQRKINEMAEDFYAIHTLKTRIPVTLTSLASWVMIFFTLSAYMKGFGIELSFTKMIFASTIAVIANAIPLSGIGNWGTLEAGWAVGFILAGLSKEKAITTGFGVHIITFILCTLISLFCWLTLKNKALLPSPK